MMWQASCVTGHLVAVGAHLHTEPVFGRGEPEDGHAPTVLGTLLVGDVRRQKEVAHARLGNVGSDQVSEVPACVDGHDQLARAESDAARPERRPVRHWRRTSGSAAVLGEQDGPLGGGTLRFTYGLAALSVRRSRDGRVCQAGRVDRADDLDNQCGATKNASTEQCPGHCGQSSHGQGRPEFRRPDDIRVATGQEDERGPDNRRGDAKRQPEVPYRRPLAAAHRAPTERHVVFLPANPRNCGPMDHYARRSHASAWIAPPAEPLRDSGPLGKHDRAEEVLELSEDAASLLSVFLTRDHTIGPQLVDSR